MLLTIIRNFFSYLYSKLRQRLIRNEHMTYLWGNWPQRPGFPSRSRGRVGFRPQANSPHALRHRAPVTQATSPWKLSGHRGQQHRAVVLRRDLHRLLVLLLRDANVHLSHLSSIELLVNQWYNEWRFLREIISVLGESISVTFINKSDCFPVIIYWL